MDIKYFNDQMSVDLIHSDRVSYEEKSRYVNIYSPFSRFYYVERGGGEVIITQNKIKLQSGYIYFIPSFETCTLLLNKGLIMYVVHCSIGIGSGKSVLNAFNMRNQIEATTLDHMLFKRIKDINPELTLKHDDPKVYEKDIWSNRSYVSSLPVIIESLGIVKQILSRFIDDEGVRVTENYLKCNIEHMFFYIKANLGSDISLTKLAEMACLSPNHFSKVFKDEIGMSPCEFILSQRLELAQMFLVATDMSIHQIVDKTNFKNLSYFSRVFKAKNGMTPSQYREKNKC